MKTDEKTISKQKIGGGPDMVKERNHQSEQSQNEQSQVNSNKQDGVKKDKKKFEYENPRQHS